MANIGPDPRLTIPWVRVAVGILVNAAGEVLLTQRPRHVHQGGLWEFPGGKLEPGEDVPAALRRELHEELGITVQQARPLLQVRHRYPDKAVRLEVWRVERFQGEPHGREGQPLRWVAPAALSNYPLPAADVPIVHALRLPPLYLISGEPDKGLEPFLQRLERALQRGIRLVQVRARSVAEAELGGLYQRARTLAASYGASVLLNGPPVLAARLDADGVHLSSTRLLALRERPLAADRWVAASCHNRAEIRHAATIGVDFLVLSPVCPTASHPGATPLGWERFQALIQCANRPVYALGGLSAADLPVAWQHGAQGVAALRALWEDQ